MTQQQLKDILLELSFASKSIANGSDLRNVMNKYDMLFLGENFNLIYSAELRHTLKDYFGIEVSNEDLNLLVPLVCKDLRLECSSMYAVSDLSNPNRKPYCYQIKLW